jgi:hypothetical protein
MKMMDIKKIENINMINLKSYKFVQKITINCITNANNKIY